MYLATRFGALVVSMLFFFIVAANKDGLIGLVSTDLSQCGPRCLPSIEKLTTGVLISFFYASAFFIFLMPVAMVGQIGLSKVIIIGRWLKVDRKMTAALSKSARAECVIRRWSALMSPWAVRDFLFSLLFLIAWWSVLWNNGATSLSANGETLVVNGHLTNDGFRSAVFYSIVSCATIVVFLTITFLIGRTEKSSLR